MADKRMHRRILLSRLSALGDIIHTMPVACGLRDLFPNAHIAWVVQEGGAALVEGHPAIDELITVPKGWMKSPFGVLRIRKRLRAGRYDLAIDGQGLAKSALLAWLSNAPRRIGFAPPWGRELSPRLMTETVPTGEFGHIVERNMRLLDPLGGADLPVRFDMPTFEAARESLQAKLREASIETPLALLNVGAGWPSKRWPPGRFAQLAERLKNDRALPSLAVFGNEEERTLAEETVAASNGAARLAPKLNLQELVELIRVATLFVGGDTGPLHIAAAVETPCVGLYGPFPAERHGPFGPRCATVQKMRLSGSVRERRKAGPESMEAIDVDSVVQACSTLVE